MSKWGVPCPTCGTMIEGVDRLTAEVPLNRATQMVWKEYEYAGPARWWPCGCEALIGEGDPEHQEHIHVNPEDVGITQRVFEEALERGDLDDQRDQARREDRLVKHGERLLRLARKIGIKR